MGILDSIVEWIATQVMNLLDLITGSVLGALGCDMSTFLRYFPAAETLYEIFVAIGVGFILLLHWCCAAGLLQRYWRQDRSCHSESLPWIFPLRSQQNAERSGSLRLHGG